MKLTWTVALEQLRSGQLTDREWFEKTAAMRRAWCAKLNRRYQGMRVTRMSTDDVEQEFLLQLVNRGDKPFSVTHALLSVGKKLGRATKRSAFICSYDTFDRFTDADDPGMEHLSSHSDDTNPGPEEAYVRDERYDILSGLCDTRMQRVVIRALRECGGNLDVAAEWLVHEGVCRTVRQGARLVESTVAVLAATYEPKREKSK